MSCAPCAVIASATPVAAQIVEQHNVILPQGWCQHLFDIGAEALAVHGAIEDTGRGEPGAAQTGC
jgi:hypothetical protein